jgi:hypothetical protein
MEELSFFEEALIANLRKFAQAEAHAGTQWIMVSPQTAFRLASMALRYIDDFREAAREERNRASLLKKP